MPGVLDPRLARGGQSGDHERSAAPEVLRLHRGAGQRRDAGHDGDAPLGGDLRAETAQLRDMAKAVFENVLDKHRGPLGLQRRRHEQRLGVRREAGVRSRHDRTAGAQRAAPSEADKVCPRLDLAAHSAQAVRDGLQVRRADPLQQDVPARGGGRAEPGGRRDAVRHHAVARELPGPEALDHDLARARPADTGAFGVEEALEVLDLRLARRVGDARRALRRAGREHDVLRRADAREVEVDMRP